MLSTVSAIRQLLMQNIYKVCGIYSSKNNTYGALFWTTHTRYISVWKKRQYGSSWVQKPLVILFTECWWPITQEEWRGNRDLCQTIATWERTHARLLSIFHIAGLLEYVTASLSSRGVLWPTRNRNFISSRPPPVTHCSTFPRPMD